MLSLNSLKILIYTFRPQQFLYFLPLPHGLFPSVYIVHIVFIVLLVFQAFDGQVTFGIYSIYSIYFIISIYSLRTICEHCSQYFILLNKLYTYFLKFTSLTFIVFGL